MKCTTLLVIFSSFIIGILATTPISEIPLATKTQMMPEAVDKKTSTTTIKTTEQTTEQTTTTTTENPSTPTLSTTSTSSTTPTPTPEPSTTTAAPKTTTVAPKPAEPQLAKYYVEENNVTCILVEFAVKLNISYGENQSILYNLPSQNNGTFVKTDGKCGNDTTEQTMVIIWLSENQDVNTLNLTFKLNSTSKPKEYSLTQAVFNLSSTVVPNNNERLVLYHVGSFFQTRQSHSYHCGRAQTLNLTKNADPKSEVAGQVILSHVFMEAYHSTKDQNFSETIDCDAINTPDIVPIAVGIALIALVVVVLIAYLVGRRRAQSRGYVSM